MAKEICGAGGEEFDDHKAYLNHVCSKTGHKPTEIAHLDALTGGQYSLQSKAALARGAARKEASKPRRKSTAARKKTTATRKKSTTARKSAKPRKKATATRKRTTKPRKKKS